MRCSFRSTPPLILLATCLLSAPGATPVRAQQPGLTGSSRTPSPSATRTVRLERSNLPIRVDGVLNDEGWSSAAAVSGRFIQQAPDEGAPASQRTSALVLTDGRSLYIAARLTDSQAGEVVARLARRDQDVHSDWFYVYIDGHRDRRSALGFGVNAAGVQRDVRIAGDDGVEASWNAIWESAVRQDPEGWTVEIRIPLSQLRFDPGATDEWGLQLERRIARRNERSLWAPVPQAADRFVSLFGALRGVQWLEAGHRIELMPYVAGGLTAKPVDEADPFRSPLDPATGIGADLRAGLGAGFTLSATLNPDFGQVEADPAAVNLSAFEIFQSERRPFFVEGADIFEMAFPSWPPLFYSRRIGRSPQAGMPRDAAFAHKPAASTILSAAKVTGRTGGWTLGLMEAVTARETGRFIDATGQPGEVAVEPLTSYSVGRVARQFRQGRTGIGLLATAVHRDLKDERLRFLHSSAYSAGLDGWHRFADGTIELRASLMASHVRGDSSAILRTQRSPGHYFQRPHAAHVRVDPSRTSLSGYSLNARLRNTAGNWRWSVLAMTTSPGYEVSDLGFNPSLDQTQLRASLRYQNYTPGPVLRSWQVSTSSMYQGTTGGERLELTQDLGFSYQLLNYWGGRLWVMRHQGAWEPNALRGGPALRKPGRWMGNFALNTDKRRAVNGTSFVFWEIEDETGGYRLNANASLAVRTSERFDISIGPSYVVQRDAWQFIGTQEVTGESLYMVGGIDRATIAASLRTDYTLSPNLSFQFYARPYLSAGRYYALREVRDPQGLSFTDRFRTYDENEAMVTTREDGRRVFHIDRDGDDVVDFSCAAPDFNLRSFQLNFVARWQYSPGSTLFVVWSHDREAHSPEAADFARDMGVLADIRGRHVLMVKASYWLGL